MFCQNCGTEFSGNFCQNCGANATGDPVAPQYQPQPTINIVNTNTNVVVGGHPKDKWIAFVLCLFFGVFGVHKFYEGRIGMGILYIFTAGLFGIGWFIDLIVLLCKPNPYYI